MGHYAAEMGDRPRIPLTWGPASERMREVFCEMSHAHIVGKMHEQIMALFIDSLIDAVIQSAPDKSSAESAE